MEAYFENGKIVEKPFSGVNSTSNSSSNSTSSKLPSEASVNPPKIGQIPLFKTLADNWLWILSAIVILIIIFMVVK